MALDVEADFSGFPFAGLRQQGGDPTQEGRFVRKEAGDAGAASDFLIERIPRAHPFLVGHRQAKTARPSGRFSSSHVAS